MEEIIKELERKWNNKCDEYTALQNRLSELESSNKSLQTRIHEAKQEALKYKNKWTEMMRKIEGEMKNVKD